MRRSLLLAALITIPAGPVAAQDAPRSIVVDRAVSDSLASDGVHPFTIDLPADQFVMASVEQHTIDVVITIKRPDGSTLRRVDFTARGPEPFQFETDTAGRHVIELSPFREQTGRYTLVIRRAEAVATRPAERVDQLMAAYDDPESPGVVVGVIGNGTVSFARAYGAAELAHDIPFTVDTRTNIGSTSKQFTAFAILLLERRGLLSLDDDVRRHIPELPDFGQTITIRHLLTHTTGYREFLNALALAGRRLDHDWIERSEIIRLVQRQPELQNEPGAEWNYNNTAFALAAEIVERVSGEEYPDWMRANVFEPLGMTNSQVRSNPSEIVPGAARGYTSGDGGAWIEAGDLGGAMGAGAVYTTIGDLARWMGNFRHGRVGGRGVFDEMATRYVLTSGDTTDYGLGLFVDEYRGLRRVHHGGADIAHRSMLVYFPELDAGVVVLSNNATADAGPLANQVADAFFADRLEPRDEGSEAVAGGEPFDAASYDVESFEPLVGSYELVAAPGFILRFRVEGDTIFTQATGQQPIPIYPTSDSTFELRLVAASLTFHRNADGSADSLTLHQNGDNVARRVSGDVWEPDPSELTGYAGRYFSPELETFYVVEIEDEALAIRHPRWAELVRLSPGSERDRFTGTFPVGEARFLRDEAGVVNGLEVGNVRTRGVHFVKTAEDVPVAVP